MGENIMSSLRKWREYEARKMEIADEAKTTEEYQEKIRELIEELGL